MGAVWDDRKKRLQLPNGIVALLQPSFVKFSSSIAQIPPPLPSLTCVHKHWWTRRWNSSTRSGRREWGGRLFRFTIRARSQLPPTACNVFCRWWRHTMRGGMPYSTLCIVVHDDIVLRILVCPTSIDCFCRPKWICMISRQIFSTDKHFMCISGPSLLLIWLPWASLIFNGVALSIKFVKSMTPISLSNVPSPNLTVCHCEYQFPTAHIQIAPFAKCTRILQISQPWMSRSSTNSVGHIIRNPLCTLDNLCCQMRTYCSI